MVKQALAFGPATRGRVHGEDGEVRINGERMAMRDSMEMWLLSRR